MNLDRHAHQPHWFVEAIRALIFSDAEWSGHYLSQFEFKLFTYHLVVSVTSLKLEVIIEKAGRSHCVPAVDSCTTLKEVSLFCTSGMLKKWLSLSPNSL